MNKKGPYLIKDKGRFFKYKILEVYSIVTTPLFNAASTN